MNIATIYFTFILTLIFVSPTSVLIFPSMPWIYVLIRGFFDKYLRISINFNFWLGVCETYMNNLLKSEIYQNFPLIFKSHLYSIYISIKKFRGLSKSSIISLNLCPFSSFLLRAYPKIIYFQFKIICGNDKTENCSGLRNFRRLLEKNRTFTICT
jgi:hypothetical protein